MVNNLELLKPLLRFTGPRDFYYLTILKRKADDPLATKSCKVVEQYAIYSIEQLEKYMPQIIADCEHYNARAYLYVNRRDAETVGFVTMELLANYMRNKDFAAIRKAYWAAVGRTCSAGNDKLWVVDIDTKDPHAIDAVYSVLHNEVCTRVELEVPTKNGVHLLTKPFNRQEFSKYYPDVDIHKDNPTILYIP